ncbi:MAG: caspase family protein [Deltaproteobacteria bacterium]|nr:caspase family protein [Deltaproteobacteria bacterium]
MIYRTSQNDMQPITFEEARKKALSLFWEEGDLSVGLRQVWKWEIKSFKVNEDGLTVVYKKDNSLTCDFEFINDPVVNDWGPLADFQYAIELRGSCNVNFWFDKKESAITFAKAFYTLKHRSAEVRTAKKQAALQSKKISKITVRPIPVEKQVLVKSDVDDLPLFKARQNKNAYAIVIGVEKYRQKLPKADFADNDARIMTEYLTKVMGYPEENIVTLINDHAAKSDMEKYFEKWLSNNVEKEGIVFVYYSGHGAPNPNTGDAYLVPYDGDPSFIEQTGYSLKRLYHNLNKLPAKEIIVVLDSCFSGAGGRSVLAKGARPLVMNMDKQVFHSDKIAILSASSGNQISSTHDKEGHGLFTYFFLKGIKDGNTELGTLYNYLKPQVERIARKTYNNEQTPGLIAPTGLLNLRLYNR